MPIEKTEGGTIFTGNSVKTYAYISIAVVLETYAKTGMLFMRGATLKQLMASASKATGKKYKARAYREAAADLRALAHRNEGIEQ